MVRWLIDLACRVFPAAPKQALTKEEPRTTDLVENLGKRGRGVGMVEEAS